MRSVKSAVSAGGGAASPHVRCRAWPPAPAACRRRPGRRVAAASVTKSRRSRRCRLVSQKWSHAVSRGRQALGPTAQVEATAAGGRVATLMQQAHARASIMRHSSSARRCCRYCVVRGYRAASALQRTGDSERRRREGRVLLVAPALHLERLRHVAVTGMAMASVRRLVARLSEGRSAVSACAQAPHAHSDALDRAGGRSGQR